MEAIRILLVNYTDYKFEDEKFFKDYFLNNFDFNVDKIFEEEVKYVEIEMDDVIKTAYIIFKNRDGIAISERMEEDWYAIMDSNLNEKGAYNI